VNENDYAITQAKLQQAGTDRNVRATVCGGLRRNQPYLVRLAGDRTRSQRSGTRFPYTNIKVELDHEKQNVSFREIMYEYVNVNEYDWLGNHHPTCAC
jgi:hypothetical protein